MDELLNHLRLGFDVALLPGNLAMCFVGALLGTLIGILPGLGPAATIAMLLPLTFHQEPTTALIMLAGIYYGAQYGGSTTAILVNIPGESSSVVTCLDGHQMARQGRAGSALAIAALSSFLAGTFATAAIVLFGPILALAGQQFGPAEYFALMVFGLVGAVVLARGDLLKAVAMVLLGLLLGLVGADVETGEKRFTFGIPQLFDGIDFVPLAMGLFGIADIISNLERREGAPRLEKLSSLWPTRDEFARAWPAALRGTGVGTLLGILPGGGALLSSFAAYTLEKKIAADPSRFGRGAVEGVAAPEAANNAGAQASFVPMLTLGIPSNIVMALMVGAMMIHGITPGPLVMVDQPRLFWGLIASMWVGNVMLLVINLPLVGVWVSLLRAPYRMLFPAILAFCAIGSYSLTGSWFAVAVMAFFGVAGYFLSKLGFEPAPLVLGFVLGPLMEENLRRALVLSRGDPVVFVSQPISLVLLGMSFAMLVAVIVPAVRRSRETAFVE